MERQYANILRSKETNTAKKMSISRIVHAGTPGCRSRESIYAMLRYCTEQIARDESKLAANSSREIFHEWARNNLEHFVTYFDTTAVGDIMFGEFNQPADAVWLLHTGLVLVKHSGSSKYELLCGFIRNQASNFVRAHADWRTVNDFCALLLEHPFCIPFGEDSASFCSSLLDAVSVYISPHEPNNIRSFVRDIQETVGMVISAIWRRDPVSAEKSVREVFDIIAQPGDSSLALTTLARFLPENAVASQIQDLATSPVVPERNILVAACHMIDWLRWPMSNNVSQWIVLLVRRLAVAHKYSILMEIAELKVMQLFVGLRHDAYREQCFHVLETLLLGYRYSPYLFHSLLHELPSTVSRLYNEQRCGRVSACRVLPQLVELLHCLMFMHPGFPEFYRPVVAAINMCRYLPPSLDVIYERLKQHAWWSASCSTGDIGGGAECGLGGTADVPGVDTRSETGLTGLNNLGNTCYMNCVLQALYMCDIFRRGVLTSTPAAEQTMLCSLQRVFTFLTLTERPAYLAELFFKESKPPWFSPNVQHDCSEFLKYLLDQLHEQELSIKPPPLPQARPATTSTLTKSDTLAKKKRSSAKGLLKMLTLSKRHTVCDLETESTSSQTLVERTFGGKIISSYVCLQCRTESSKSETFTDLALAFPEESGSVENSCSVAVGSDPSCRSNGARLLPGGSATEAESPAAEGGASSPTSLPTVKSVSLESLLEHFLRPERLVGSNQYQCSKCGGLRDGERRTMITFAPPCLVLPLLRFAYDTQTGQHNKICTDVLCPLSLRVPVSTGAGEFLNRKTLKSGTRHVDYTLASVIVHSGLSSDGGHYYCYAHQPDCEAQRPSRQGRSKKADKEKADADTRPWFMFNDNRVVYSSYDAIKTLTQTFARDTAYVLFYRRIEVDTGKSQRSRTPLNEDVIPATSSLRLAVEEDNRLYHEECAKREMSDKEKRNNGEAEAEHSAALYFYDDDDDDQLAASKQNEYGSYPLPDY